MPLPVALLLKVQLVTVIPSTTVSARSGAYLDYNVSLVVFILGKQQNLEVLKLFLPFRGELPKLLLGKKLHIIINAEGVGDSNGMAKRIEAATGLETRATIIGYIQRGGSPTCRDRVFASAMGARAVDILIAGAENRAICFRKGEFTDIDLAEAISMKKDIDTELWDISRKLCR